MFRPNRHRKAGRTLVAITLGLAGAAVRPAHAQSVTISIDATAPGAPIEHIWPFHGYDEVNYSTTPEGRALLQTLASVHTTPAHIRTHFLLNTGDGTPSLKWGSTNVYTEDAAGNPVYSWTITDAIMDAITGAGALPFTEIAFMPEALSTHPTPYQNSTVTALDGGCFYPPKDYGKWSDLIRTWAMHLDTRYPNVPAEWLWELWNEPDIGYFHGTLADYTKLYDYTEAALHGVMPTAQLGGPAVAGATSSFLPGFLQHCATGTNAATGKTGTRLDLVTFHAKGGVAMVGGHVEMNLGHQLTLHKAGFSAVAAVSAFKKLPIYVTEADPDGCAACSLSSTPADAYRLSPAYGAYEIAMMKRTLDLEASLGVKVGGLVTWAFTFPGTPYFAGYRALSTNGIDLPVLAAFRLLGSLQGARLPVTSSGAAALASVIANSVRGSADVDAMATLDGDKVQILVWNYHDDLVAAPAAAVALGIKVPAAFGASVTVDEARVDDSHGDAYTTWQSQGSPKAPTAAQIQALQGAMLPQPIGAPRAVSVMNGTATVSVSLPRFGVSLLTVTSGAGAGVVDGSAGGIDAGDGASAVGGNGSGTGEAGGSPAGGGGYLGSGGFQTGAAGSGTGGQEGAAHSGSSGAGAKGSVGPSDAGGSGCGCVTAGWPTGGGELGLLLAIVLVAVARRRAATRS
jgi:xylan 1,4-beta-xylosidase